VSVAVGMSAFQFETVKKTEFGGKCYNCSCDSYYTCIMFCEEHQQNKIWIHFSRLLFHDTSTKVTLLLTFQTYGNENKIIFPNKFDDAKEKFSMCAAIA
jgi:hypothetical protein